jgi:hypothetical protein
MLVPSLWSCPREGAFATNASPEEAKRTEFGGKLLGGTNIQTLKKEKTFLSDGEKWCDTVNKLKDDVKKQNARLNRLHDASCK